MPKDHHADGQHDQNDGKYNPPHSITPLDQVVHDDHTLDKMQKDNDEYDAGYDNARRGNRAVGGADGEGRSRVGL